MRARLFSAPLCCLLLLLVPGISRVMAQLEVDLSFERENYASLEIIEATVTVKNTVGNDIVLGGPNGTPWLNFLVHDSGGTPVTAIRPVPVEPLVLRGHETLQRKFPLQRYFFLSESGTYIVKASAYFPDLDKYNQSRPKRFTVQQPRRPKWQQVFSVPGQTGYRRFEVFIFDDTAKSYVFLSVIDEDTKMVMSRTALGSLLTEREIQPAMDSHNHLHLIYQGSPTMYVYQQIDSSGNIADRKYFLASKGQPKLMKDAGGGVSIAGGVVYDPLLQPKTDPFRKLSERPASLPR